MTGSKLTPPTVDDSLACNLIPMIDIMFLLLLFFMLSADMSSRELEAMELAEADMVKEEKNEKGLEGITNVNIHHESTSEGVKCVKYNAKETCTDDGHWLISIRGNQYDPKTTLFQKLAEEAALEMEEAPQPGQTKVLSKRKVVIRADGLAEFGFIQKVMEACGAAGIYKIEISAARPTSG